MKNIIIHLVDIVHADVLRHRWPSCNRVALSSWWSCDGRDRWCRVNR